jgi:predicted transcriptional regulator of viral defense system
MAGSTLSRLASIAEDQWGLVTRQQAEVAGVSRATIQRLASSGVLERVAQGVYHLSGAPVPDRMELRAAWLQLAPGVVAWERSAKDGVVSHRSAAVVFGLGHLPADQHDFIVPTRRQTRRPDVRLHRAALHDKDWLKQSGLPVTRPGRTAVDLLISREDPEAVGHVIADALRMGHEAPVAIAASLAPAAQRMGLRAGDGLGVMRWLLDLTTDDRAPGWVDDAWRQLIAAGGRR